MFCEIQIKLTKFSFGKGLQVWGANMIVFDVLSFSSKVCLMPGKEVDSTLTNIKRPPFHTSVPIKQFGTTPQKSGLSILINMRTALPTVVVLIASLLSATIANPVPGSDLPNSVEKRVIASINPTTVALPEPTRTDANPAIDTGVLNCQKGCKNGYHYCLGTGSTVLFLTQ